MGGAGFTEILLLAVIALIVVGPQKLPRIARTAGRLTRQARNAWQGLQSELQAEMDAEHNRKIMQADKTGTKSDAAGGEPPAPESSTEPGNSGERDEPVSRD